MIKRRIAYALTSASLIAGLWIAIAQEHKKAVGLPSSKYLLLPVPGTPQPTNSLPTALALSPDGRYLAILNNGYGTPASQSRESIGILDLASNQLKDFPDERLGQNAPQTYFIGLAWSGNGQQLYASMASLTQARPRNGSGGNGIAVYSFSQGALTPQRFISIAPQPLAAAKHPFKAAGHGHGAYSLPNGYAVPYPAGLAVITAGGSERLLVADNLSDDALLIDSSTGEVLHRFDLSDHADVPAAFPYTVVATRDGRRGYCSLWNASAVAELDLSSGRVVRRIPLLPPESATAPGSHPSALLLSPDERLLYVTLSNRDRIAVIDTASGELLQTLLAQLPGQQYEGTAPDALALSSDGRHLLAALSSSDAVAVFDAAACCQGVSNASAGPKALGFIPTEWYPTALAVRNDDLLITTGKGEGTGPNSGPPNTSGRHRSHPYIASLIQGSIARVSISAALDHLGESTREVAQSNLMAQAPPERMPFKTGENRIKHVIYIIKENRTYDQIFGDLKPGNGDDSLTLYGADITPNEHKLARQFGIIDNFYDSGEVSGDGHTWSTAGISTDYTEKTWEIAYRGQQRLYDYEGEVENGIPLDEHQPDVNEPATGYIWTNVARHGLSHRNYGEYVYTLWCNELAEMLASPRAGTPLLPGEPCARSFIQPGEAVPRNMADRSGSPSPYPWPIPLIARDIATKPELVDHFDPQFADFRLEYPDQFRADEFLFEFDQFVRARGTAQELPAFIFLRLPNDHTAGTTPGKPRPAASVADNDLAVGRVVDAVSHSPYWDDTAILALEDDAQDGADHVDAHRSIALVISKYSPGSDTQPFVDSHFYTTVSMLRTIEALLGLPPLNNNDAHAPLMSPLFSGNGDQPPYTADYRNRDNKLIYQANGPHQSGAAESARLDFSHADAANAAVLNAILWRDRKGAAPMPVMRLRGK